MFWYAESSFCYPDPLLTDNLCPPYSHRFLSLSSGRSLHRSNGSCPQWSRSPSLCFWQQSKLFQIATIWAAADQSTRNLLVSIHARCRPPEADIIWPTQPLLVGDGKSPWPVRKLFSGVITRAPRPGRIRISSHR